MAYTLNTSHALYSNLIELFGVQSGALVSHKTARTFTKHADASYGTGTYGEHFTSVYGVYTAKGASFTPALTINTTSVTNYTVVAVFNDTGTSNANHSNVLAKAAGGQMIRSAGKNGSGNLTGYRCTGSSVGTGATMLTYCRIGETAAKMYINATQDYNQTGLGADYNDTAAGADYLLGWDGQNAIGASLVWLAVFDKELSGAEISDLYNSLGASNAFGLVGAGVPTLAVADGTHAHLVESVTLGVLGTLTISDAAHAHIIDSITITATSNGTITIPAVRDWGTKALKVSETGVQVDIRNITTGALVVRKTGQTTHATTGVCVVTDAAIVAGTTYEVVTRFADGSRGMWDYTAS